MKITKVDQQQNILSKSYNIKGASLTNPQKWILILVLFLLYFYYFISSSGINSSNDSGHMALASSIYHDHQLSVEKYWMVLIFPPDYAVKDGKLYSDRLPGNAFSIIPFLAYADFIKLIIPEKLANNPNFDIITSTLLPNICGVIGLLLLFLICFKIFLFRFWTCLIVMIIAGIATLNHLESIHLFSHAPSMMSVTLAVTLALFSKNSKHWKLYLYAISAVLGYATIVELQNILFFIPLFFYVITINQYAIFKNFKSTIKMVIICSFIMGLFIGLLLFYNYSAFGELILKSNKYNPFFKEELSFFTSLSGNFFSGIDNLFTSFNNIHSYINWSLGTENNTPGLLVSNPVFIFSILGFIPFFKHHKKESLLFLSLIIISVLIASFHVTTLVRHIFTVHMLLFMPFIFFLNWISYLPQKRKIIWFTIVVVIIILSFIREVYICNHYFGRAFHFGEFPYLKNIHIFLILNIPLLLASLLFKLFIKRFSRI
ncbi:MAG: hypothetical protein KKG99_16415 [Bacteroidetes bacterium]|nr:hypothetical protein [Bacteroidota bacterium]